jgi:hypothetical protein
MQWNLGSFLGIHQSFDVTTPSGVKKNSGALGARCTRPVHGLFNVSGS